MPFLTALGRVYEEYAEGSRREFTGVTGKLVAGFAILYSLLPPVRLHHGRG